MRGVLEGNPAYREIYIALIDWCAEERALEEAQALCEAGRTSKSQIASGAAMVDTMVRAGALAERVFVSGEPYDGTLEALQADEEVPEDAVVAITVQATEAGRRGAAAVARERSLDRLVQSRGGFPRGARLVRRGRGADHTSAPGASQGKQSA